jgi:lipopolysaccharide transport system permease protein
MAHNILILPLVFLVFLKPPNWNIVLLFPGLFVVLIFLFSATYVLAVMTTRFRDMQQISASFMTVALYVTPVIWEPSLIPSGTAHLLLGLNPFYHFLQIIRLPLLGQTPTFENWFLAISITLVAGVVSFVVAKKFKNKLAYWV